MRISAGPVSASETPSKILPHVRTTAPISHLLCDHIDRKQSGHVAVMRISMPRTRSASPCVFISLFVGCAYVTRRSFRRKGVWKAPSQANGHEAEPEAEECARDGHGNRGEMQHVADYNDGSTSECGDGIQVGTQDCGNLGHKDVTRHPATD